MSTHRHSLPSRSQIRMLGGVRTVTGSRFLVETPRARVLIDCGAFQGPKQLRARNWEPFPTDPSTIDALVLTHAHIDHSGWVPRLVKHGFAGEVHVTAGTADLVKILFPDSGRIHEEDAKYANEKGFSKHSPALPLFTEEEALAALANVSVSDYHGRAEIADGVELEFSRAGHILGSASVTLTLDDARPVFSGGDIGRGLHPLLADPDPIPEVGTLLVESTYGDREHSETDGAAELADAINRAAERGGAVVIPAFAVDRTEVILYHIRKLMDSGRIPIIPVYADSPMALAALEAYREAVRTGSAEIRGELHGGQDDLFPGNLVEARTVDQSKQINFAELPAIIVSASGMATGGRVLHHLARRLPDPASTVILVGYQAPGTRGRRLLSGEPSLKLHGRYVPVRAHIANIPAFSVHADRSELIDWLSSAAVEPDLVLTIHGDDEASEALRDEIGRSLGWNVATPRLDERIVLGS